MSKDLKAVFHFWKRFACQNGLNRRDLPGHEILATSNAIDGRNRLDSSQAATIYNGPKDNVVFNAASIWYAQGVSSPPGHVLPARGPTDWDGSGATFQSLAWPISFFTTVR